MSSARAYGYKKGAYTGTAAQRGAAYSADVRRRAQDARINARSRLALRTGASRLFGRSTAAMNARTGGLLGIELKFLDEGNVGTALTSSVDYSGAELDPTVVASGCIGCPAQGDGASARDGRSYVIKSIVVEGEIRVPSQANQTAADVATVVHLALVQDTQTNGVTIVSEQVFSVPSAAAQASPYPQRNLSYIKRYKVHDWTRLTLPQPHMVWDGTNIEQGGYAIPFKLEYRGACKVVCSGTTQDVAQVQDNSFHVVGICSNTGTAPVIYYNARTRFVG